MTRELPSTWDILVQSEMSSLTIDFEADKWIRGDVGVVTGVEARYFEGVLISR
jgi:hypothetical protein